MAYIFKRSRFLHVPRTGGKWLIEAATQAGMRHAFFWPKHSTLKESVGDGLFTFAFVRLPETWYQSYFGYKMTIGRWGTKDRPAKHEPWIGFDEKCQSAKFSTFIDNMLTRFPGFASKMFGLYIGNAEHPIDCVGRFENLVDHSAFALREAGEQFNLAKLVSVKPLNRSDYSAIDVRYTGSQLHEIRKHDSEIYKRFYGEDTYGTS